MTREIGVDTATKGQAQVEVETSGHGATTRTAGKGQGAGDPCRHRHEEGGRPAGDEDAEGDSDGHHKLETRSA